MKVNYELAVLLLKSSQLKHKQKDVIWVELKHWDAIAYIGRNI